MSPSSNRSRNRQQGKPKPESNRNSAGQVRIIAGQWRGRKLAVAEAPGLRPTGNRVRETLFNWLQSDIPGSHCLDLFAGSGALGFEALSRFAASATFVEPDSQAFGTLQASAALLDTACDSSEFIRTTAAQFLSGNRRSFDIVFIDPPFDMELQWETLAAMGVEQLAPNARVYVESPVQQTTPEQFPHDFRVHREKVFGDVRARLLVRPVK